MMLEKIAAMTAAKIAEKLGPWLIEQFTKLIPVIVGAVVKALTEKLDPKKAIDVVIDADPDWPGISNLFDLSEFLKSQLRLQ